MESHYHLGNKGEQYFIHNYESSPELIEMSFDLSCYQPMLAESEKKQPRVFQTIFLDKGGCEELWTRDKIKPEKVHLTKWWRQFAHVWTHFLFTVPLLRFIQGGFHNNIYFAGAYTLFNTHELAAVSGMVAAERLGAKYPFAGDKQARKTMDVYSFISHGFVRPEGKVQSWKEILVQGAFGMFMSAVAVPILMFQGVLMMTGYA